MTLINSILFLVILPITILSCGDKKEKKRNELNEKNKTAYVGIIEKYSASIVDSINDYTFSCQKKFIEQKSLLGFKGSVSDIIKTDSNYILQVYTTVRSKNYVARIIIDTPMFQRLLPLLNFDYRRKQKGCFIIKVSQIISKSPSIDLDIDSGDEENDSYVSIGDFGSERILIFKGTLVDFYLNESK